MPSNRFTNVLSGLSDSLCFSNWLGLLIQRTVTRNAPVVHYVWKGRWHLYCCPQYGDHGSVKEVLAQGAYDKYLAGIARKGTINYINAGANVGAFDVAIASEGYASEFGVSIELNPWTYTRLAFNLACNGLNAIHPVNAGLAAASGEMAFSARGNSVTDCIYNDPGQAGAVSRSVALESLDSILEQAGLEDREFDLLKLDIEGAEYEVVSALSADTLRKFRHIIMEFHTPPQGHSPSVLYKKLGDSGFVGGAPEWTADQHPDLRHWHRV